MNRDIKFRAWDNALKHWDSHPQNFIRLCDGRYFFGNADIQGYPLVIMQYTGLHDKNGLTEIYECDILGIDGLVRGNMYESPQIYQERTDLIIPSITSKDWCEAYQTAMARGCKHTE